MAPVGSVIVAGLWRLICLSNQRFFAAPSGLPLSLSVEKLTRCGVGDAPRSVGDALLTRVGGAAGLLAPYGMELDVVPLDALGIDALGKARTRSKRWQRSMRACWSR